MWKRKHEAETLKIGSALGSVRSSYIGVWKRSRVISDYQSLVQEVTRRGGCLDVCMWGGSLRFNKDKYRDIEAAHDSFVSYRS
jgi:hypothetical protein